MPHKHVRRGEVDKSTVDLPPTSVAEPLPVSKSAKSNGIFTTEINAKRNNKKRKRKDDKDDTPKAFARLMAFAQGKKLPKGLDDGVKETKAAKKRRVAAAAENEKEESAKVEEPRGEVPSIRPGERMSDFSARVDAALPVSGLINKSTRGGKDPLGLKVGRTKTEKRMHRMYDEWRQEEARRQEKRQEALELAEEEEMDEDGQVKWKVDVEKNGKKKKGKKRKVLGEVEDGDDDPWAKIKRDRGEVKAGLNEVVLAPPTFSKIPKEKFKIRGGARVEIDDVPKASGSLRRREELGEVRKGVVEGYRQMMKEKSGT
ncbi:uncharacterized protein LY89DRAFT_701112 [Mollisia scopiformis]|uniref:Uncharacterized protein n=1 Tax=Mollisia scopiformis TaxID=149040 RepID=A0A132BCP8_MOLSC|nr:uncharacterized protein LY89DRAFT_701112 [Mollisia scopiformis]KUJ10202.1 hypothetical protein LY89DRAFT_701112 [Mollisia scopiformis]